VRFLYASLAWLLAPVFLLHLLWRSFSQPEYRRRLAERFGYGLPPLPGPTIWIHAVSVGEVTAAAPLVRALRECHPRRQLLVTTMTPTGSRRARDLFGDTVHHVYVPYDSVGSVRRFFDWARPELALVMETEIWPNLFDECGRRSVPLVLASARVSKKSVRRYRILFSLIRDTLANGIVIGAQSETDAERFRALGANPARTNVTGNIKFDFVLAPQVPELGRSWRATNAAGRPVWLAASTHDGEETLLLDAHRRILASRPDALLILVPRHPARFAGVATLIEREGFSGVTRSSGNPCGPATQVFLGDSMGELTQFYAACDVAFVGGSLVRIGGHNLLEPAALNVPALTGPYNFNAPDIAEMLTAEGAVCIRSTPAAIAAEVLGLFADPAERERRGRCGLAAIDSNRGAVSRLFALVEPMTRPGLAPGAGQSGV